MRFSRVDKDSRIGVPSLFPFTVAFTVPPFSPLGPGHFSSGVPTSSILWIHKTPINHQSTKVSLASSYCLVPLPEQARGVHSQTESMGVPRFLAIPFKRVPWSKTPVVLRSPHLYGNSDTATHHCEGGGFHIYKRFRSSILTANALAVYASECRLLTHPAKLATNLLVRLWSGWTYTSWNRLKSFNLLSFVFPPPKLAWRDTIIFRRAVLLDNRFGSERNHLLQIRMN